MLKRTFLAGSLAFWLAFAKAQTPKDTSTVKVSKTDIELVYNHYLQDGKNSAVTGGIGTEKLSVYAPAVFLKKEWNQSEFSMNVGCDIITSASTDNIDYIVSSASRQDLRTYSNLQWSQNMPSARALVKSGAGFSIESDYLSLSAQTSIQFQDKAKQRTVSLQFQFVRDDLRWGRLNPSYYKPVRLIYPAELRYKSWFSNWERNSFNLKTGLTQIINRRNTVGIFPEISFQSGLLSTPFHRVYFSDQSKAVEKLPDRRLKWALALKWNRFTGGRVILKTTVNGYRDNFGIQAVSFEEEVVIKINQAISFSPQARIYSQTGSGYFGKYMALAPSREFYTSDYDLSRFQTVSFGMGFQFHPQNYMGQNWMFNAITFRYNYGYRSNGLKSNQLSLILQTRKFSGKPRIRNKKI